MRVSSSRNAKKRQIEFWMAEHQRVPSLKEVMEITGYGYQYSKIIRKEVCEELPKVEWNDVWELVKNNIKDKLEEKDGVTVPNLIQMLPFITPKKTDIKTDSNLEFKITIQKPDDVDE